MDFLISAPKNLIEGAKREIQRLTSEVQRLNKNEILNLQQIEEMKKEFSFFEEKKSVPKNKAKGAKKNAQKGKFTITLYGISLLHLLLPSFILGIRPL
jgi:hypothetical protein